MPGIAWKGLWDASVNAPYLGVATESSCGHQYIVSVDGEQSINGYKQLFSKGDQVISNGVTWEVMKDDRMPLQTDATTDAKTDVKTDIRGNLAVIINSRPIVVHNFGKSRIVTWEKKSTDSGIYRLYYRDRMNSGDDFINIQTLLTTYVDVDVLVDNEYLVFDVNNDPLKVDEWRKPSSVSNGPSVHKDEIDCRVAVPLTVSRDTFDRPFLDDSAMAIINAPGTKGVYILDVAPDDDAVQKIGPILVGDDGSIDWRGDSMYDLHQVWLM